MSNCPGNLPLLRFPLHGKIQAFQAPSSLKRQNNFCYVTVRVVVSSGSLSSGPCCPDVWRPRLEDSVITLPFVVWTISKAELMAQRHIRGHWHGWSHRLPQQCLQQHLRTRLTYSTSTGSLLGWQRGKLASVGTHTILQLHCQHPRLSCSSHKSPTPWQVHRGTC